MKKGYSLIDFHCDLSYFGYAQQVGQRAPMVAGANSCHGNLPWQGGMPWLEFLVLSEAEVAPTIDASLASC